MSSEAIARTGVRWRTSSYTSGGQDAECVEIGVPPTRDERLIRDTKNPGPELTFSADAFRVFVDGLRSR